jgi:hypothetical protein
MSFKSAVLAVLTLTATAMPAFAGEGKFSALMFGDAYWMAANHDSTLKDMNGLWIRRFFLTYDYKFDDKWSARMRTEANMPGDFKTAGTISLFMKDAYIKWQYKETHAALMGIQLAPTVATYEDVWGYRSIEKAPVELQAWASSRDAGIGLTGDFGAGKKVGYHLLVGNGNNYNAENNTRKNAQGAIHIRPRDHVILEGFAAYDDRTGAGAGGADRFTWYGLGAWQADKMRAGIQYAEQKRHYVGEDAKYRILSGFITGAVRDKLWLFGRVDRNMDPNPQGDTIAYLPFATISANTLFIGGADFVVADGVDLMPNVEIIKYDDPDVAGPPKPDTDVMARLTFQAKF